MTAAAPSDPGTKKQDRALYGISLAQGETLPDLLTEFRSGAKGAVRLHEERDVEGATLVMVWADEADVSTFLRKNPDHFAIPESLITPDDITERRRVAERRALNADTSQSPLPEDILGEHPYDVVQDPSATRTVLDEDGKMRFQYKM